MRGSIRIAFIAFWLAVPAGGDVRSQGPDPSAMAKKYAESARANAALMAQYSWKMSVDVALKGQSQPIQLYEMRHNADGKLLKTSISAPVYTKKKKGIRGSIQRDKTEEFKDWAGELAELLKTYLAPTPANMLDFYNRALMLPPVDGTAQMSAADFLQKGDKATYWINAETNGVVRFAFTTSLDGDRVEATVDFDRVAGGPQYPAAVTVAVPTKEVTAKIATLDYVKQ